MKSNQGINQKSQRGRPKNSQQVQVIHPQRQQKPQQIKQYWTQHRITLIAYQAQYIYNKKQQDLQQHQNFKQKPEIRQGSGEIEVKGSKQKKSRKGRKKANPEFETGFLFHPNNQKYEYLSDEVKVEELVKDYKSLQRLFNQSNKDVDDIELRQFVKIMLQLKNKQIVHQFLPIYDLICNQIARITFGQVEKEKPRHEYLKGVQGKLLNLIKQSKPSQFKHFKDYLQNDQKETVKLLYVQAYCFLAEKFNFNINEYYSDAFNITLQHGKMEGRKKIKGQ